MAAGKFISVVFCLASWFAGRTAYSQTADSIPARNYHYTVLTLFSRAGLMFSRTNSTIQVDFPYSITDPSGKVTDTTFHSGKISPYRDPKWFLFPIALEVGDLKNYIRAGFAFEMIGNWTKGYRVSMDMGGTSM
jgi:hypothetical protein